MDLWSDLARDISVSGVAHPDRWARLVEQAERVERELASLADVFAQATAEGTSTDGAVCVEVNGSGVLVGLTIDPRARRTADELSDEIVALVARAAETMRTEWNQSVANIVQT